VTFKTWKLQTKYPVKQKPFLKFHVLNKTEFLLFRDTATKHTHIQKQKTNIFVPLFNAILDNLFFPVQSDGIWFFHILAKWIYLTSPSRLQISFHIWCWCALVVVGKALTTFRIPPFIFQPVKTFCKMRSFPQGFYLKRHYLNKIIKTIKVEQLKYKWYFL
jgi:hypothetical protein